VAAKATLNSPASAAPSFSAVAPYYDELMRGVPYQMWTGYYLLLLAQQDYAPKTVLDVACGTGTMTELLADEGLTMSGIDLSAGMIREAQRKNATSKYAIEYHVADATDFELPQPVEAALSFFDSLNNLLDPLQLADCFASVYRNLKPGGSWIFDLNTGYAFETELFDQSNLKRTAKLKYDWKGAWDPESRIITVTMNFWWKDEPFTEIHRQRAYEKNEVFDLLEAAGFVDIHAYHSYTLNPPRAKSDRLHYLCRKPS